MEYLHVKDDPSLKRDPKTGALVSSVSELEAYRIRKTKLLVERDKAREFQTLKNEVADIKSLLLELLQKIS